MAIHMKTQPLILNTVLWNTCSLPFSFFFLWYIFFYQWHTCGRCCKEPTNCKTWLLHTQDVVKIYCSWEWVGQMDWQSNKIVPLASWGKVKEKKKDKTKHAFPESDMGQLMQTVHRTTLLDSTTHMVVSLVPKKPPKKTPTIIVA